MRLLHESAAAGRALAAILAVLLAIGMTPTLLLARDAGTAGIASGGETVLLREAPGWDAAVLADVPDGSAVEVAGEPTSAADGAMWLPVVIGGQSGYVPAGYVASSPAPATEAAEWTPDASDVVAQEPAADPALAPDPVSAEPEYVAPAPVSNSAVTTADANLRSWPGMEAEVLQILPPGSPVAVTGPAENGFVPVEGNGAAGWLATDLIAEGRGTTLPPPLLATEATIAPEPSTTGEGVTTTPAEPGGAEPVESIAPPPDLSTGESTGIIWPFAGGEWEVVQGYNNGTHTNRGGFAQYKYSLDWARADGNTAGQPVYAPVSGTIEWTDRGSGGMLIDAGNGYGVAVFHVTIDRSVARGGSVERGQQIGTISGPGGDGYMSMAHVEIACWRLSDGGHESVPFTGPNAIAGQEFPDTGGGNQYMGATVSV